MTPEHRASWAHQLMENPVLSEILDGMEEAAIAFLINAEAHEHDVRQAKAAELRVIRDLQERIKSLTAVIAMRRAPSTA